MTLQAVPHQAAVDTGRVPGAWWKGATVALMVYVIYGAFFIAGGAAGFGEGGDKARIVFFHVPMAVLSSVCYAVGFYHSLRYLVPQARVPAWLGGIFRDAAEDRDLKAAVAMELGLLFCVLATITGSIFAGVQWGSYWNWDPREISIVAMLLLYAGYLVLRADSGAGKSRRARLCAAYAIVALIPAQFLIWIIPRIASLGSLHPTTVLFNRNGASMTYRLVLYPSFLAFIGVYAWLSDLRIRTQRLSLARTAPAGAPN